VRVDTVTMALRPPGGRLPGQGCRVHGEDEGRHASQGRTPVPRDQTLQPSAAPS